MRRDKSTTLEEAHYYKQFRIKDILGPDGVIVYTQVRAPPRPERNQMHSFQPAGYIQRKENRHSAGDNAMKQFISTLCVVLRLWCPRCSRLRGAVRSTR